MLTIFAERSVFASTASYSPSTPPLSNSPDSFSSFLQRLYAKGIKAPENVIQHCLTLFRQCRSAIIEPEHALQHFPPSATLAVFSPPPILVVGGYKVREQGPLACLEPYLDVGARRVLPGHLLRRSRVLGTLHMGRNGFQQRISLTARTGEESIFTWHLQWTVEDEEERDPDVQASSLHEEESFIELTDEMNIPDKPGRWIVQRVERDSTADMYLPTTLQPKSSPESVVKAQLAALHRGDIYEASSFNNWESSDPFNKSRRRGGKRRFTMGIHYEMLREMLAEMPYGVLMKHQAAVLGPAAVPTQGSMLQEVWVKAGKENDAGVADGSGRGGDEGWTRFIWKLELQAENGCWVCCGIVPCLEQNEQDSEGE